MTICQGIFKHDIPDPGVYRGNKLIQNTAEAKICTIISLDTCLNGMASRTDPTRYLTVQMKRSIPEICSFLDAQFSFIPIAFISLHSGLNSLSECIPVILKPRWRYYLCTYVIPSALLLVFRFLIILHVANMMCRDMLLMKQIPLAFMSSHQMVTSLYFSRMVLVTLVILTGSTCWILRLLIPYFCGPTKGPHFGFWAPPSTSQDYTYDESRMTDRRLSYVL